MERTYVFMDESGDSGFKLGRGSTQIFCIAAAVFRSPADIVETERCIRQIRSDLGLKKTHEFHFNSEPHRIRRHFCEAICHQPFVVRAIVVDKNRAHEDTMLRKSPSQFYNFIVRMLPAHSFGTITNAKVKIDGSVNRELKSCLRRELNRDEKIIHDTGFSNSVDDDMIQLADMMAGSIARSYRGDRKDEAVFRRILRPCIQSVWDFGYPPEKKRPALVDQP